MTLRRLLFLTAAPLALSACGDDLESRNEAAGMGPPVEGMVITNNDRVRDVEPADTTPADAGFAEEGSGGEEDEDLFVDAAPDELVDSAEGFDTSPADDTAGIDPNPPASRPEAEPPAE